MAPWVSVLKREVNEITNNGIEEWSNLVNQLGLSEKYIAEWTELYKLQIEELQNELNSDLTEKRTLLINEIEGLLIRSQKLCRELGTAMPDFGCKNLGLYGEHKELNTQVDKLQKIWDERMKEVKVLLAEQNDLCKTLERKTIDISAESSLPSPAEVDNLKQYIKELEQEKYDRSEKFINLKCECIDLAQKLKSRPKKTFEKCIINGNDSSFIVSSSNLEQLENFHRTLTSEYNSVAQEICDLQQKVKELWNFLDEDEEFCDAFIRKHQEVNNQTLRVLRNEFSRCEDKKRANIGQFVKKIRNEIWNLWEKCLYSDEERAKFDYFYDDIFTSDLLELHELELQKLKQYYEENKSLCKLVNTRMELWSKMMELVEKEGNPNRFKNRGGQLLLEEKERKQISKKLLNIEEKILSMAATYEENNGIKFMCWGESIEEVISKSHSIHEQTKKIKLSARKQDRSLTPSNMQMMRTPASCKLKTRSKLYLNYSPNSQASSSTSSTSKIGKSLLSKRYPQTCVKENKPTPGPIPKIRLNGKSICKSKISFSTERKKRIEQCRRISRMLKKNPDVAVWSAYNDFKTKVPARSTIFLGNGCSSPLGFPLPKTPSKPT